MTVVGIDHVQLAMPAGAEAVAEAFYSGILGMTRLPKPEAMAARGGCWFRAGALEVHVGVEPDFRPARKAHPGLRVRDLDALVAKLDPWTWNTELPQVRRGFTEDPFGNRLELVEVAPTQGMPPVVGLVTLGVADVARATAFYEALGWPVSSASVPGEVTFLRTNGGLLGLWSGADMSADAGRPAERELAINLPSPAAVDAAVDAAVAAGAELVRAPQATDWGGWNALIADLDGHLWELAHNPFWPLDDKGMPVLPL